VEEKEEAQDAEAGDENEVVVEEEEDAAGVALAMLVYIVEMMETRRDQDHVWGAEIQNIALHLRSLACVQRDSDRTHQFLLSENNSLRLRQDERYVFAESSIIGML
jgi:hypothetical protein